MIKSLKFYSDKVIFLEKYDRRKIYKSKDFYIYKCIKKDHIKNNLIKIKVLNLRAQIREDHVSFTYGGNNKKPYKRYALALKNLSKKYVVDDSSLLCGFHSQNLLNRIAKINIKKNGGLYHYGLFINSSNDQEILNIKTNILYSLNRDRSKQINQSDELSVILALRNLRMKSKKSP